MGESVSNTVESTNLYRLGVEGPRVSGGGVESKYVLCEEEWGVLVPRNVFGSAKKPDKRLWDGSVITEIFDRVALLIFPKRDEIAVVKKLCGSRVVLQAGLIPVSPTETTVARSMVDDAFHPNAQTSGCLDSSTACIILKHALAWKDHSLWNRAVEHVIPAGSLDDVVDEGLHAFGFDSINSGLEDLVKHQKRLQTKVDVTKTVAKHLEEGQGSQWSKGLITELLVSYGPESPEDVLAFVQIAKEGFAETISTSVLPKTKTHEDTFDFHITLTDALHKAQDEYTGLSDVFKGLAREALAAAIEQWKCPSPSELPECYFDSSTWRCYTYRRASSKLLKCRVDTIAHHALALDEPGFCQKIFDSVDEYHRIDVLDAVRRALEPNTTGCAGWVKDMMRATIEVYRAAEKSDVPNLAWIAQEFGGGVIKEMVVHRVQKSWTWEFLIPHLAFSLRDQLVSLPSTSSEHKRTELRKAIIQCVTSAIPQWEMGLEKDFYFVGLHCEDENRVEHVLELVDLCLTAGDLRPCCRLFKHLLTLPSGGKVEDRVMTVLTPLLYYLRVVLYRYGLGIMIEPFHSFFRGAISLYLARVVGPKSPLPALPTRAVGCGCEHCREFDTWLRSASTTPYRLSALLAERTHVEREIDKAHIGRFVTTETCKAARPHTLVVSKRVEADVVATTSTQVWEETRKEALEIMQRAGLDNEGLRLLMPERYDDVMCALQGSRALVVHEPVEVAAADIVSRVGTVRVNAQRATERVTDRPSGQVAGVKRKSGTRAPQLQSGFRT